MSEYEHTILFVEFAQACSALMANFMTLVFAMVVTSYIAAHRLDRVMMWLALAIYSMFTLGFINEIFQVYSDLSRLGIEIATKFGDIPEKPLSWFGPVAEGPEFLYILPYLILFMTLLTYVASILFFLRARKANLASNVGPVETVLIQDDAPTDDSA